MVRKRIRLEVWLTEEQIKAVKRYTKEVHGPNGLGITWRDVLEARMARMLEEEIAQMGTSHT